MCLFSSRPKWEDDIVFASRPKRHSHHSHSRGSSRTYVTETYIKTKRPSAESILVPLPTAAPLPSPPEPTPPPPAPSPSIAPPAPSPPPPPASRVELVSVEEDLPSPRSSRSRSHASTSHRSHSRSRYGGSRGGDEEYIVRERIRERMSPPPPAEYETFRYVEGPNAGRRREYDEYEGGREKVTKRVVERERVRGDEEGRREYWR